MTPSVAPTTETVSLDTDSRTVPKSTIKSTKPTTTLTPGTRVGESFPDPSVFVVRRVVGRVEVLDRGHGLSVGLRFWDRLVSPKLFSGTGSGRKYPVYEGLTYLFTSPPVPRRFLSWRLKSDPLSMCDRRPPVG